MRRRSRSRVGVKGADAHPLLPGSSSGAPLNCKPIRLKTNLELRPSVRGGEGQNRGYLHHKRRVLAAGPRLKQDAVHADM